jgi:hypothetical protein
MAVGCAVPSRRPGGRCRSIHSRCPLAMSFPRRQGGQCANHSGAGHVYVLVESSTRVKGASSDDCETFLRSIRINGKRVEVSPHRDRVASCPRSSGTRWCSRSCLIRAQDAPRYRSGGTIKLLRAAGPLNATRHPCAACRRLDPAAAPTPPPGRGACGRIAARSRSLPWICCA